MVRCDEYLAMYDENTNLNRISPEHNNMMFLRSPIGAVEQKWSKILTFKKGSRFWVGKNCNKLGAGFSYYQSLNLTEWWLPQQQDKKKKMVNLSKLRWTLFWFYLALRPFLLCQEKSKAGSNLFSHGSMSLIHAKLCKTISKHATMPYHIKPYQTVSNHAKLC